MSEFKQHEWDFGTCYCIHCGLPKQEFVDKYYPECPATDNVHGISHLIARRKWQPGTRIVGDSDAS